VQGPHLPQRGANTRCIPYNLRIFTELFFRPTVLSITWVATIALVGIGVLIALSHRRGTNQGSSVDRLAVVFFVAALAVVVTLTLQTGPGGFDAARPARFDPIYHPYMQDALANVMLYLPVGFFAVFVWRSRPRPVVWATGLAFTLSFTIELAQWVLPIDRAATTHDVLSNTLGGFIGAMAGILVVRLARKSGYLTSG
jgi:VanZ family protein